MLTDTTLALPTFNDEPSVVRTVLGAAASEAIEQQIIVVDMSTDCRVRDVCAEFGERIAYHHYPESTGVSASRNRCVSLAHTRYVTLLDSDVRPTPGWLGPLAEQLREPDVAVVASRILPDWLAKPPRLFRSRAAAPLLSIFDLGDTTIDVARVVGGSYGLDRELVADPPFDPRLGRKPRDPLGLEENALCEAARSHGFRVIYVAESLAYHMIPKERLTWRFIWSRARVAGRERRIAGKVERLPGPPRTKADAAFLAAIAPAVLAGAIRPRSRPELRSKPTLPIS